MNKSPRIFVPQHVPLLSRKNLFADKTPVRYQPTRKQSITDIAALIPLYAGVHLRSVVPHL